MDDCLLDCRFLGEQCGYARDTDDVAWHPQFYCSHDKVDRPTTTIPQCKECRLRPTVRTGDYSTPIQVELHSDRHVYRNVDCPIVDRFGRDAAVESLYLGGHVFLILGGPSLGHQDLTYLDQPGIVKFGINNVAAAVRCQLWTYGDTSAKFHDVIWKDPGCLKFAPFPKLTNNLRELDPAGKFVNAGDTPMDCPGVLGIKRNAHFRPEQWLHEDTINWGHGGKAETWLEKEHRQGRGDGKHGYTELSTFFQAVRLCYYLGFRHVYLLGCDFTMTKDYRYAFSEERHDGAVRSNNSKYAKQAEMFADLRPYFDEAGFHVYNLNPDSHLKTFETLGYNEAIHRAMRKLPEVIQTSGWYESV